MHNQVLIRGYELDSWSSGQIFVRQDCHIKCAPPMLSLRSILKNSGKTPVLVLWPFVVTLALSQKFLTGFQKLFLGGYYESIARLEGKILNLS
jgi:hypothetical protein